MIYLISGNPNKLLELQHVFPPSCDVTLQPLDLEEIQDLDPHAIVRHKLREAYKKLGAPVIVEDVSAELANLHGLPGPFIKFFEQQLGRGALYTLSGEGTAVIIRCSMGYYDGSQEHIVDGILHGTITAPRGEHGFGFDCVIIPDGYGKTLAEFEPAEKNRMSHRFLAAQKMAEFLATN